MAEQVGRELARIVKALKPTEQQLLRLRFLADYSYEEIGYIVNSEPGTVRVAMHRLLKRLRDTAETDVKAMFNEHPEVLARIPSLQLPEPRFTGDEQDLPILLEEYVIDPERLAPSQRTRIEQALETMVTLREQRVRYERRLPAAYDVEGHSSPGEIPARIEEVLIARFRAFAATA